MPHVSEGEPTPKIRTDHRVRYRSGICEEALKRIKRALEMKSMVIEEFVMKENENKVFKVRSYGDDGHEGNYEVHMQVEPSYSYVDFLDQENKANIFLRIMGLSQRENMFIHNPILTKNEVYNALARTRTYLLL